MSVTDRTGGGRACRGGRTCRRSAGARALVALSALLLAAAGPRRPRDPGPAPTRYAVVTHPAVPTRAITMTQLRRLFLGQQATWPDGTRVVPLVPSPGAAGRAFVLRRVCGMDERAFRRYWIPRTFVGGLAGGPKLVATAALARQLAAGVPGAVAVIPAGDVDATVRVLRVDGRLPGEAVYPLTSP